ncbi:MAG: hypothetical protein ABJP79_00680 [Tateyamaria sp.]|uniref:hypothetical protein n=1 Tax=Tateyamaria sp. TaxID=1929288 RepID=UPI0032A09FBB
MSTGLLLSQVKGVFDVIESVDADLLPKITYLEAAYSQYDTTTRQYTGGFCQHPNIPVVITQPEIDASQDVAHATVKFVVASENMPDSVVPKVQDRIQTSDLTMHNVIGIKGVPGDSLYLIYCEVTA